MARLAPVLLLAALWLTAPAPEAMAADGKMTGKITLKGKPLAEGKITFYLPNGQFVGSKIKDGKYLIDHMPAGTFKVTVEGKGVPAKFGSEETAFLTVEIKDGGGGEFDFDLN